MTAGEIRCPSCGAPYSNQTWSETCDYCGTGRRPLLWVRTERVGPYEPTPWSRYDTAEVIRRLRDVERVII